MQLNDLASGRGLGKNRKRIRSGNSSGHGTTAGRGTKGQLSRSGGGKGAGLRAAKRRSRCVSQAPGFKNHNRVEYAPVNVSRLGDVR